jgi:fatty-acyl-CoA synthase
VSGTSTQPLLGETIGENLRRTVERFPKVQTFKMREQAIRELGLEKAASIETA